MISWQNNLKDSLSKQQPKCLAKAHDDNQMTMSQMSVLCDIIPEIGNKGSRFTGRMLCHHADQQLISLMVTKHNASGNSPGYGLLTKCKKKRFLA